MKLHFYKYQGTGNDFVMIDNRSGLLPASNTELIKKLCDRRFGIGGDGLIYLQDKEGYDFEMVYFNSDGNESSMCGNGGRCIVQFAYDMGMNKSEFSFSAIDGLHRGRILADGRVSLQMQDVKETFRNGQNYILNTGSPHEVHFVQDIHHYPVFKKGKEIRYSEGHSEGGINVNFVQELSDRSIYVRTYERGVEDETLSCGTGVVASAIANYFNGGFKPTELDVQTRGGQLHVSFDLHDMHFHNIWLTGPAARVYKGEIEIATI